MNPRPIFLLGAHKSGTTLLRSLLDGHSRLYTIPFESHFFANMDYWIHCEYRKQHPKRACRDDLIREFCTRIHISNTTIDASEMGDTFVYGEIDEAGFEERFSCLSLNAEPQEILERYFDSIYFALNGRGLPEDLRTVEKSVENAEFAVELTDMYPEASFIHIVRNPYSNLVSMRKHKSAGFGYALIHRVLSTLDISYYYLYQNPRVIEKYLVIRYEDLVTHPRTVMQEICAFLGLPFEETLLIPTHLGRVWRGNSSSGEKFDGISASTLDRWKRDIQPMEVFYVNRMFGFVLENFGYESLAYRRGFWRPARGENLQRYMANRLFRFYL